MMKVLLSSVAMLLLGITGTASADDDFYLTAHANVAAYESGRLETGHIPVADISGNGFTFAGDVYFENFENGFCCFLDLGYDSSFTITFDNPVKSIGVQIFHVEPPMYGTWGIFGTTVSASYIDSDANHSGFSSTTADWVTEGDGFWNWDNTFNGHVSTFGVSTITGISEITFNFEGGTGIYSYRSDFTMPAQLGTAWLYYESLYPTTTPPIPEPETYAMMLAGLGMLGFTAKRGKKHAA